MVKRLLLIIILTGVVAVGAIIAVQRKNTIQSSLHPSPTIPSSGEAAKYCSLNELDAVAQQEAAAGTVYTTLTMENVSGRSCEITGNNFVKPVYSSTNITVRSEGKTGNEQLVLAPGRSVYSLVHYPNGPQCQSLVEQTEVSFMYQTSPSEVLIFHDQDRNTLLKMTVCSEASQETVVTVRGLSESKPNGPESY